MRRGGRLLLVALAVLVSACGGVASGAVSPPSVPSSTLATLAESTGFDVASLDDGDVPEAVLFLAAVDLGLAGTAYEGDAFDDPETYLGTGVLFCQMLESGLSHEEVLTAYILAMQDATGGAPLSDDDLLLGGVILGAAVESLCVGLGEGLEGGS